MKVNIILVFVLIFIFHNYFQITAMHYHYYWQPCTPHRGCDNKWSRRAPDLL